LASIWNVTFAVCDNVKAMDTWPVAVSEAVARLWLLPLFGHSMAWPPEAAASFTTTKGENVLWPERLSSSTDNTVLPLDELEELLLDEEPDELLLEDEELDSHIIDGTLDVLE
jgi:hypothetical protein